MSEHRPQKGGQSVKAFTHELTADLLLGSAARAQGGLCRLIGLPAQSRNTLSHKARLRR
jgi:hypothetical protein